MNLVQSNLLKVLCFLTFPAFAGGVSGGGGGTIIGDPAREEWILSTIGQARGTLTLLFNEQSHLHIPGTGLDDGKLFDGTSTIFDILKNAKIEIKRDGPCLDPDGIEVDGSADGKNASICVSSLRLTQKLSEENYFAQTLALMAHEYSHLVGYDEAQAQSLQRDFLAKLQSTSHTTGPIYLAKAASKLEDVLFNFIGHLAAESRSNDGVSWTFLRDFIQNFSDFPIEDGFISVLNEENESDHLDFYNRARIYYLWSCSQNASDAGWRDRCKATYSRAFPNQEDELEVREATRNVGYSLPFTQVDHHMKIHRIKDKASENIEQRAIEVYLGATSTRIKELQKLF